jgi:hypothetical protein
VSVSVKLLSLRSGYARLWGSGRWQVRLCILMKIHGTISAANIYLLLVAALLVLTAGAKLFSAAGEARILATPDSLLLLSNREVLIGVGLLELAVAAFLVLGRHPQLKHLVLVWLSLNFIVYRVGLAWVAPGKPCTCLGVITARLPLKPDTADLLLKLMIGVMLFGSVYFLLRDWLLAGNGQRDAQAEAVAVDQRAKADESRVSGG